MTVRIKNNGPKTVYVGDEKGKPSSCLEPGMTYIGSLSSPYRHKITGKYDLACGHPVAGEGLRTKVAWFWKDVTCRACLKTRGSK